ncbi:MAG: fumarylacetoacetate hydrolase family protein [Proteobacteria bacterium]|nr:fumarylacetoacetate hydrolase family protein [Pseudomonadota bacterium]MDA1331180.1 fumarylacetoacetate hydrolase family protein [Pseudomonadota bacterium]
MSLSKTIINDLGNQLYEAWNNATQIVPITDSVPGITIEEAYQVQLSMINRRLLQGESIVGKKIGITAKAIMNMLGVNQPDFGHLMSGMQFKESQSLPFETFCQPKGEGEIAFLLRKDLMGPGITTDQVITAIDCVVPAFEIVDSRIKNWNIKIQDTVADNASAAAFVLGSPQRSIKGIDLATCGMVLKKNGEIIGTGVGAATLDHPLNAVAWLANMLGSLGMGLKAGEIILSGSLSIMFPIHSGDTLEMEIAGIGKTICHFD